jgi:hypothetical protein
MLEERVILLGRRFLGAEKSNRRSRQYRVSSGPPQKTERVNFQNQCSGIEAPRVWPGKTIKCGGHRSVSRGNMCGSWRDRSARKQRANRQSSFGPTCRLISSPEAGSGATVGTLKQGYPLLQYEGAESMRLSLVTWQTAPDPTTWAAPGPPRGRRRRYTPMCQQWVRTPMGKCRTSGYTARTSGQGPGPPRVQTGPPGRVPDLSAWGPGHSQQSPGILGEGVPGP